LAPVKLNTLFISKQRLPISFSTNGNVAFLSQSGAFFITRLSNLDDLPLKYAFCIGNQLDLSMGEMLDVCASDNGIELFALYLEGLKPEDLHLMGKIIRRLVKQQKRVLVYKGGRSDQGALAAAGHTGSIAGVYAFEQEVFQTAGAMVCDTMEEFSLKAKFYAKFNRSIDKIGVISNAGYETVRSADLFDKRLETLNKECLAQLSSVIAQEKLSHLVTAANPLDVTPMASESLYLKSIEVMLPEVDLLVVALVPLTEMLALTGDKVTSFAKSIRELEEKQQTPIVIVIDSGELYNSYRQIFRQHGLLVFSAIEKTSLLLCE
jgi:acyl-CoA synthetase (NDP forming)